MLKRMQRCCDAPSQGQADSVSAAGKRIDNALPGLHAHLEMAHEGTRGEQSLHTGQGQCRRASALEADQRLHPHHCQAGLLFASLRALKQQAHSASCCSCRRLGPLLQR